MKFKPLVWKELGPCRDIYSTIAVCHTGIGSYFIGQTPGSGCFNWSGPHTSNVNWYPLRETAEQLAQVAYQKALKACVDPELIDPDHGDLWARVTISLFEMGTSIHTESFTPIPGIVGLSPENLLDGAIDALLAERRALDKCPVHRKMKAIGDHDV